MASESDCQQRRDKRPRVWSSQNEWAISFFRKDYKDPKRPFCCQVKLRADDGEETWCTARFGEKTSKVQWVRHLTRVHMMDVPSTKRDSTVVSESEKQLQITSLFSCSDFTEMQREHLCIAYCMNPRVPLATMDNAYWKLAHEKSKSYPVGMRSSHQMRTAIVDFSKKLEDQLHIILKHSVVGLQSDGGKDVSHNKLIATLLCLDKVALLYECFNTEMTVLNEESYTSYYTRILKELEDLECFCVSTTTDNEASPNAGIDAAIQNDSQSFASFPLW